MYFIIIEHEWAKEIIFIPMWEYIKILILAFYI